MEEKPEFGGSSLSDLLHGSPPLLPLFFRRAISEGLLNLILEALNAHGGVFAPQGMVEPLLNKLIRILDGVAEKATLVFLGG